jgi:hypothetical protein
MRHRGFPKFIGKFDTLVGRDKRSRRKLYEGRIKATRGLQNIRDPKVKAMTHRIVRRKLNRELVKETNE